MFWHHAIEAVGAGLATVLGNLQVIIVGFFAWLLLGERPSRATLLALPVVLAGVILISGVVGAEPTARTRSSGSSSASRPRSATPATCCSSGAAVATSGARPGRWRWRPRSSCCARSSLGEVDR